MKIKKGDTVIVLAGKDKGKTGKIIKVMPKDEKVLLRGVPEEIGVLRRLLLVKR